MYAFTFARGGKAVLMFRFDQPDAAIERLLAAGITVLSGEALESPAAGYRVESLIALGIGRCSGRRR